MKITKIEETGLTYSVTFEPNWLEKLFGIKIKVIEYKDTMMKYAISGKPVYIDKSGKKLDIFSKIAPKIDEYRRSW